MSFCCNHVSKTSLRSLRRLCYFQGRLEENKGRVACCWPERPYVLTCVTLEHKRLIGPIVNLRKIGEILSSLTVLLNS